MVETEKYIFNEELYGFWASLDLKMAPDGGKRGPALDSLGNTILNFYRQVFRASTQTDLVGMVETVLGLIRLEGRVR